MTPFFRSNPLWYNKFENMVIFRLGNYIHFLAQETRIHRKNLSPKNVEIDNAQVVFFIGISCNY